jgi:hypothetical protein
VATRRSKSAQAVFEPRREPAPNRELFLAPRGRSTQHVGFGAARDRQKLRFDLVADLRLGSFQQCSLDVSQRRSPRPDEVLAAPAANRRQIRVADDAAVKDPHAAGVPVLAFDHPHHGFQRGDIGAVTVKRLVAQVLEAAYEATLWAAVLNTHRTTSKVVYLTRVGGGAFGNETAWIHGAIRRALKMVAGAGLDVRLVSYGQPDRELVQLVKEFR